jgi:hypothetical protein
MSSSRPKILDGDVRFGARIWRISAVLVLALISGSSFASERLWVEDPGMVAFSIANMTPGAQKIGLTSAAVAANLTTMLSRAGLKARRTSVEGEGDVLFVDIIVEEETYYASLGFWRIASYRLPNGELNAEFVTVWQDYSVGAHHNNPETVQATVSRIIERFIGRYTDANKVGRPLSVASAP